ncbi:hypothetical protein [Streptomyces gilvosporeus]|uniref:Uncharacterized protein n=1 Tax=Streptomyces gilvosporeus TaxID=553510 RepID=A0A1V0U273_9ACTN|nr:hypothetical protein [Streptomyces gilvosporeus]ARF59251.1 hypothetical protein B1H19_05695 [Streptomyces gilvosporeus]
MTRDRTAGFIGGIFGVVFIGVNAGSLPPVVGLPLRALAVAAFVGLAVVLRRDRAPLPTGTAPTVGFGRRYWWVVAVEAVVGVAGILAIRFLLHAPHVTVAWIALVVGLHFFGLAAVWRLTALRWLGAGMSACGAAGLALGAYGASPATIAAIAGVAPGALLLSSVWWGALNHAERRDAPH